jgi:hypothetical protein
MRIVSNVIGLTIVGSLLAVGAVSAFATVSTVYPMIAGSWQAHRAHSKPVVSSWDDPEFRARFGHFGCSDYDRGSFIAKAVLPFYRDLAWCADRKS